MSSQRSPAPDDPVAVAKQAPLVSGTQTDGMFGNEILDELTEKKIDEIEMIGEETAAGYRSGQSAVSAGMRYLHASRTIHQLVTDRNRAVGLFLAVATLLWTASTALLNAKPTGKLRIPIQTLQEWCLPVTFGTMTVLAVFVGLLLVRTRVGLIYEVAKMNVLLGIPIGRVKRINPMSVFFLMHLVICLGGGGSAALFTLYLMGDPGDASASSIPLWPGILAGVAVTLALVALYVGTVLHTTSDQKLQDGSK